MAYFTLHNGVRTFVQLLLLALAVYNRHRSTIDPHISSTVEQVIAELQALEPFLRTLSQPGPN